MKTMYQRIADRIEDIAIPARPSGEAGEYNFPEDPTLLTTDQVGRWMFTLTAWNGYILRNLALSDLVLAEAKSTYDNLLVESMSKITERKGKTRHQLNLEAISLSPEIVMAKKNMEEVSAEVSFWEKMHRIYEAQVAVLSREISRRAAEQQRESKGVPF